MKSFGRVVRRHEREAILQHPSAWDPVYRAELEASHAFARGRSRRAYSPISVVSRVPRRAHTIADPFEDLHRQPSRDSPSRAELPLPFMEFPPADAFSYGTDAALAHRAAVFRFVYELV